MNNNIYLQSKEYQSRQKRKKVGRRGPSKPTRAGEMRETGITRGMIERRKEMERRRRILAERKRQEMMMQAKPGMLTGGQAKIAAKAPPYKVINAKDFEVLRAEKAKGRGKGLQDEKMKPGKVMKADKGGMTGAQYRKYLKGLKDVKEKAENKKFEARRMRLAGGKAAMNAIKASRVGKIAAGVAGAALLAKAGLEKMYEKRTGKKPFTKRPAKKMGGGMMMQRPMGNYMGGGLTEATQRLKAQGKMGGGMMMRPNPVGMKSGKSVKVKCKLGRNKPTKMY
jgi:hypothetical protein